MVEAPEISEKVMQDIRKHVATVGGGREVVGRVVFGGERTRYDRLRNLAVGEHTFSVEDWTAGLEADESVMILHSHPTNNDPWPTDADMDEAHKTWLGVPYAIYFCLSKQLGIFKLFEDRSGCEVIRWAT